MQANAYIKSAPSNQSEDLFILHEGTKVQVLEVFNDWTKIKLSDGMIGWLENQAIEEIQTFSHTISLNCPPFSVVAKI